MNEIEKTKDDEPIIDNKEVSHLDPLDVSLKVWNEFQGKVLDRLIAKKMIVRNDTKETSRHAKSIRDFINDSRNVEIRELIRQKKPEKLGEAAQLMVDEILGEIHREESLPKAA